MPELEILIPTYPVKSFIRTSDLFKLPQAMETGAEHGMWTWERYAAWMDSKKNWQTGSAGEQAEGDPVENAASPALLASRPAGGSSTITEGGSSRGCAR